MTSELQDTPAAGLTEKRVVIYVVTGRRAGMRRIIGHMISKPGDELPKRFDNVHICSREPVRSVHLVGEFPRYVLYREIKPALKKPPTPRKAKVAVTDGRAS
jgi:hypothetical protein